VNRPASAPDIAIAEPSQGAPGFWHHVDWLWHVRGSIALPPGQSADAAFARLAPLFETPGTHHARVADTLTFTKKDPVAQDKLSVFDKGVLAIAPGEAGLMLSYRLRSPTLLFCLLLPLFFLAIAQLTIEVGKRQKPPVEKAEKVDKLAAIPLHPIDKFLGAPEPEKDKPVGKDKASKAKAAAEQAEKVKKKFSPTPAYVFAGMFAFLYLVGRILEDRLLLRLLRTRLMPPDAG
jgi:hypothetical protein